VISLISTFEAAQQYQSLNWYLVPIPPGTKGPKTPGWNTVENTAKPEYWKTHTSDNMGVLLAPSNLVVVDIDNITETKLLLKEFGIEYDILFKGAPRIKGRPGHDKAIFSAPPIIELSTKKLSWEDKDDPTKTHTVFELRGGMVQDVLPPSIHPDTHQPYEWIVEPTTKIPPLPKELLSIWAEWGVFRPQLVNACPWIKIKVSPPKSKTTSTNSSNDNIIQKFNEFVSVTSILERNGYKKVSPTRYLSPFSTTGLAGVHIFPQENRMFSHHGSEPFDSSKSHDAFDMFCHFECGGDVIKALKEAANQLGVKTEYEKSIEHGATITKTLLTPKPESELKTEIEEAKKRCLLPAFPKLTDGIFKEYMDFGKRVSYSLDEFHFAALLSLASMAIGRKAVAEVGMVSIYPNVFAMVVGQTTISGKSVACNMAVKAFQHSIIYEEPIAKCYSTNVITGTFSQPALIQGLSDTYNTFWHYDDCGGFFDEITTWNAHILGTLCTIYDGTVVSRTLSKRSKNGEQFKWECPFPFMSLLFNTTTKDIEQVASARLFSSGFFPRLMWFWGQGGQPRKNENVSETDKQILAGINNDIKKLRESLSPLQNDSIVFGVCDIIEDWKIKITSDRLEKEDESFRTAISRGFVHAYKIATILSFFDKSFQHQVLNAVSYPIKVQIPDKHAKMAVKIVEQYLIPRTMYVYDLCNSLDIKNHQVIVMKAINHFGGVADRTKVLRQTHLGKKDLDQALATLVESGEIVCHCVTKPGNDKPTMVIIKQK
jgi:hypothetical protein